MLVVLHSFVSVLVRLQPDVSSWDHVVVAFVIQIKRILSCARINRENLAVSMLFIFSFHGCLILNRPGDVIYTFLGSVKLVRYLIELKCAHQSVTEILETYVHISL